MQCPHCNQAKTEYIQAPLVVILAVVMLRLHSVAMLLYDTCIFAPAGLPLHLQQLHGVPSKPGGIHKGC
jgi:hypothetical protein